MARRLVLGLLLTLLAASPAGADVEGRRRAVDGRIARLNAQVASAKKKEATIQAQIAGVTTQIRSLEHRVGDVSVRLAPLAHELELREIRLNRLNVLFQLQSDRLQFLRRQYASALRSLNQRLVAIYESEQPDTLGIALSATSFTDFLDAFDYLKQIAAQDRRIADAVGEAKVRVSGQLVHTRTARRSVLAETRIVAIRVSQVRKLRDELVASRDRLAGARDLKRVRLATLTESERADASEIDSLRKVSAELAAKIQSARYGPVDTTPSPAGLTWPVSAPITSPFGWRWGRLHEGLDLGAAYGSPIHAAAAGRVIYAAWLGGYGNLVVIDHGGSVATAYGHQSRIAVSQGQHVSQGEVIGYVGSTGHSTGPHLHFEVRLNGQAVDPLGYL